MRTLVVYPTVGADPFDPVYADLVLDQTKADGLRVNLERLRPERNEQILTYLGARGSTIVPILHYDPTATLDEMATFARWLADRLIMVPMELDVPFVEIANEPWTMHRTPAATYAALVNAVAPALTDWYQVALACDCMRPNGWRHKDWVQWWTDVTSAVSVPWQVAAIHPYRVGSPNVTWTHWPSWVHGTPWLGKRLWPTRGRELEQSEWRRHAHRRPLAVTEVGWSRDKGSDHEIESWLYRELELQAGFGTEVVCVYAHHGEFGVLEEDRTLAPQGRAIRRWQEEQEARTSERRGRND